MKRALASLVVIVAIVSTALLGEASAQSSTPSSPEATIAAYQTQVAKLNAKVDAQATSIAKRDAKIDKQRTQIADLKAQVPTPTPTQPTAAFGQTFDVAGWSISVVSTALSPTTGQRGNTNTAKGVYLIVTLNVTNTGTATTEFPFDDLKVKDSKGRTFNADHEATFMLNYYDYDYTENDGMQPGITYTVGVAFDVPASANGFSLTTSRQTFTAPLDR